MIFSRYGATGPVHLNFIKRRRIRIIPNPVRAPPSFVLSCRLIEEDIADLLHLPPIKLRELGIMPRHIRIGVPQNFRQHVYRYSVLHRKAGERMPGAMGREAFVDIANNRDSSNKRSFSRLSVSQHLSALSAIRSYCRTCSALSHTAATDTAHYGGFLVGFVNPHYTAFVGGNVLRAQVSASVKASPV